MLTQGNVLTDGGIEQEHILFDVAHFLLELLGRVIPHVSLVIKDLALVAGQPAQKNLQQGALAAAGGTGEGVFAAFLEFRVHVDQDRLLFIVAERDILDRNAFLQGRQTEIRKLRLAGMDGNLIEIGLAGREGHCKFGHLVQSIIHAGADGTGAHKGGQRNHIIEDQDTQQDDNGHLADGADIGQTTADAVLVDGQFVLGLLHAVAGCIDSAGKPFILAKEAKHIVTCQQILDFTDAVSLAGGTGCANGSQPLAEQTRNEDHNQCDDQRNHQKQPMNGCQCNDAEHHLCRRTHDGEKRSPGHLLNLVHVVGKLGEVLAALLLMILLMGLVQQARCHIPAQSVVHPAHGPALEEGLCNQAKDHGQPGQQKKNDPNGESPQITVQQSLGDLNLYQTGADLQTIGNNHTDGGRCNSGPALFEIILHDFHLFGDRSICLYEQWIVCFALSDSNCSTQDEE